jgi:hypothetical protein
MYNVKNRSDVKREIRVAGIDDGPFDKFSDSHCLVVATIFRGGNYMDGLLSCFVKVDCSDATSKLISLIKKTKHYDQLNCIMIDGIALGGFNIVDINELNRKTKLPVIVIIRKMPDLNKIKKALNKMKAEKKIELIRKAGRISRIKINNKYVYFQKAGISTRKAAEIIKVTATHALIPEPIRIAHLITSGIIRGESKGRA